MNEQNTSTQNSTQNSTQAVQVREGFSMMHGAGRVDELVGQIQLIQQVMAQTMKDGEHYGTIKGCGNKPTLLKPGAEKLAFVFRLSPEYQLTTKEFDKGHREISVTCSLKQIGSGTFLGQGVGCCSTMEAKYRYRTGPKKSTGKPVPRGYWDVKKSDPKKAQELLGGPGLSTAKNEQGEWEVVEMGEKCEHDNPADYYNCVTPDTKVLTHDLQWVPAGEIETGDMLIGVNEEMTSEYARHFAVGEATVYGRKIDDLYQVECEDGRIVKCNGEHKWLVKKIGLKGTEWVSTEDIYTDMVSEMRGRPRHWSIMSVLRPWEEDKTKTAGYISGLLDADGSLGSTQLTVMFAQQENTVLSLFRNEMSERGYVLGTNPCKTAEDMAECISKKQVYSMRVLGGFPEQLRLLGSIRPPRLLERWLTLWDLGTRRMEGRGSGAGSPVKIKSITPIGKGEIVLLGTSCRTYIAEGLVCHNTVLKMAKKRAMVDAVLTATAASDLFAQDLEDIAENRAATETIPVETVNGHSNGHTEKQANATHSNPDQHKEQQSDNDSGPDWRESVLHFGANKGRKLGDIEEDALKWWVCTWYPKPYPADSKTIKGSDLALRNALDQAAAELGMTPAKKAA